MDPKLGSQISVLVTPEQIKQRAFLLGRYTAEGHSLTQINVIATRAQVPLNTDLTKYELIGMGEGSVPGAPLDEFVEDYCSGWDGVTTITLHFNRSDGSFVRWLAAGAGAAA